MFRSVKAVFSARSALAISIAVGGFLLAAQRPAFAGAFPYGYNCANVVQYVLFKTNGVPAAVAELKNYGPCNVVLSCRDNANVEIAGTAHILQAGNSMSGFACPATAAAIVFTPDGTPGQGRLKTFF